jgi:DNA-binding winged helix-turn-helix (wHTH) protein
LNLAQRNTSCFCTLWKTRRKVFTKRQLYQAVWDEEYYFDDNTVMVHISRIRNRIEDDPQKPKYLKTIRGIGYKLHYTGEISHEKKTVQSVSSEISGDIPLLTILATVLAFVLLSFASGLIADSLAKNQYPASAIIQEDYRQIDASAVVQNGGGVQVVDKEYRVVYSKGLDTIGKDKLTPRNLRHF